MDSIAAAPEAVLDILARIAALMENGTGVTAHPRETAVLAALTAALGAVQLTVEALLAARQRGWHEGYAACRADFCAGCTPQPVLTLVAGQREAAAPVPEAARMTTAARAGTRRRR